MCPLLSQLHYRCLPWEMKNSECRNHTQDFVFLVLASDDNLPTQPGANLHLKQIPHETFLVFSVESAKGSEGDGLRPLRKSLSPPSDLHAGCLLKVAMVIRLTRSFR